jgi:hypothetical protein
MKLRDALGGHSWPVYGDCEVAGIWRLRTGRFMPIAKWPLYADSVVVFTGQLVA